MEANSSNDQKSGRNVLLRQVNKLLITFASILVLLSILLPSLNRPRIYRNIDHCRANMRQIGNAIELYSSEFGPRLPNSLSTIAVNEDIAGSTLICSSSDETAATATTKESLIEEMSQPAHCSYVFLGGDLVLKELPSDAVLVYDPPEHHDIEEMTVLFADGEAKIIPADAVKAIKEQVAAGKSPVRLPKYH